MVEIFNDREKPPFRRTFLAQQRFVSAENEFVGPVHDVFLAPKMRVERRSPNPGALENLADRDVVETILALLNELE